jgi:hypothetical protein
VVQACIIEGGPHTYEEMASSGENRSRWGTWWALKARVRASAPALSFAGLVATIAALLVLGMGRQYWLRGRPPSGAACLCARRGDARHRRHGRACERGRVAS